MKSNRQISAITLMSVLILTGCTNGTDTTNKKEDIVTPPLTQDSATPVAEVTSSPAEMVQSTGTTTVMTETTTGETIIESSTESMSTGQVVLPIENNTGTTIEKTTPTSQESAIKEDILSYTSPAGKETIKTNLTVKNGIITDVSTTPLATHPISLKLQTAFSAKVSESVIGKAIKGLKVDTISGASLTTGAFNDFLAKNAQ